MRTPKVACLPILVSLWYTVASAAITAVKVLGPMSISSNRTMSPKSICCSGANNQGPVDTHGYNLFLKQKHPPAHYGEGMGVSYYLPSSFLSSRLI